MKSVESRTAVGRVRVVIEREAARRTGRVSPPVRILPKRVDPPREQPRQPERKILLGRYTGANPKLAPVDGRRVK
jgi:hypothetical protein